MLHLAGRRDARRWAGHTAGARINNRNRVTSTLCHWLMELHALLLSSGVVLERSLVEVGWRGEHKRWSRLGGVLEGRRLG